MTNANVRMRIFDIYNLFTNITFVLRMLTFGHLWSWCYKWYAGQHNITVAGFQQKCCFSATNVDFSCKYCFIQAKIERLTKKQHLLLQNNTFVENQQQWCYFALHIIYSIRTLRNPSIWFAQFFDSYFW